VRGNRPASATAATGLRAPAAGVPAPERRAGAAAVPRRNRTLAAAPVREPVAGCGPGSRNPRRPAKSSKFFRLRVAIEVTGCAPGVPRIS
jgi:hypothetical protein